MYNILLVDDEGIVIDSLTFIIKKNFGNQCTLETAKTGRAAIEQAESFRPDILFMDLQMPGINGLEAIEEIQSRNPRVVCIILSAYDKFSYAKQAIDLGVMEYLMKPVNSNKIVETLKKAMNLIDEGRKKISQDLEVKVKMKTVMPVLEHGFIYTLLFQDTQAAQIENYKELLEITQDYGYIMMLEYGDETKEGILTNPVGAGIRIHKNYDSLRETLQDFMELIVGAPMGNRIVLYRPHESAETPYLERIQIIENTRVLLRKMSRQYQMSFKLGIGSIQKIDDIQTSYKEALYALQNNVGQVTHIADLPRGCEYEENYPVQLERAMFEAVNHGKMATARMRAERFFDWMQNESGQQESGIRLKVLEFVLYAERLAYESGGSRPYHFDSRDHYLSDILDVDMNQLRVWFLEKILLSTQDVNHKSEKQAIGLINRAKEYIKEHYFKDLSLEEVSREVNVSPYYFSKLFKDETGENFIEYVTNLRMEHAKILLKDPKHSIKEVCVQSGYGDPNYFSRIFKKNVGVTPSEYREGVV